MFNAEHIPKISAIICIGGFAWLVGYEHSKKSHDLRDGAQFKSPQNLFRLLRAVGASVPRPRLPLQTCYRLIVAAEPQSYVNASWASVQSMSKSMDIEIVHRVQGSNRRKSAIASERTD